MKSLHPKQYEVYERRFKLSDAAKRECARLDTTISRIELEEKEASRESIGGEQYVAGSVAP